MTLSTLIKLATISGTIAVPISKIVDFKLAFHVLFWFFLADLISGIFASYFEWKKTPNTKDKWFFGKGEGFSSDKFKKMFVKIIFYIGIPLMIVRFQQVFFFKTVKFSSITDAELDYATCSICIFIFIESFSIFQENLPKCGINILSIVKKVLGLKKEITDKL